MTTYLVTYAILFVSLGLPTLWAIDRRRIR